MVAIKSVASRENILAVCRKLVCQEGMAAVNMRMVAEASGLALGSIYYYFPSKDDLLIATIESVWDEIFNWEDDSLKGLGFTEFIARLFDHIKEGIKSYPNFFTIHSVSFSSKGQKKGYTTMQYYLSSIKAKMLLTLRDDKKVKENAFDENFTEEAFIDLVLTTMMSLLVQKNYNPSILIEMVKRSLYFI